MGARRYLGRDFVQVPLHGLGIATRQDKGGADTAIRTDGAKDIGGLGALIVGRRGPRRLAPGDLLLLADPGFVLPPQLYLGAGREPGTEFRQHGGEPFLKASIAHSSWA